MPSESRETGLALPRLWNPTTAASLSLLFFTGFGAYLHAANWRTLGDHRRARASIVWVWVWVGLVCADFALAFVRLPLAGLLIVFGTRLVLHLGVLVAWRFLAASEQIRHVKRHFGTGYVRRGWGRPVAVAAGVVVAVASLGSCVGRMTDTPSADDVANEIKPHLLEDWHRDPTLRDASIQRVTLTHVKGTVYTGFVDATIAGKPERLALRVVCGRRSMRWELDPPEE